MPCMFEERWFDLLVSTHCVIEECHQVWPFGHLPWSEVALYECEWKTPLVGPIGPHICGLFNECQQLVCLATMHWVHHACLDKLVTLHWVNECSNVIGLICYSRRAFCAYKRYPLPTTMHGQHVCYDRMTGVGCSMFSLGWFINPSEWRVMRLIPFSTCRLDVLGDALAEQCESHPESG